MPSNKEFREKNDRKEKVENRILIKNTKLKCQAERKEKATKWPRTSAKKDLEKTGIRTRSDNSLLDS